MKAILNINEVFKKDAEKVFVKAITEGEDRARLEPPFDSLFVIIKNDENEPSSFLMTLHDSETGKTGFVVSSFDL